MPARDKVTKIGFNFEGFEKALDLLTAEEIQELELEQYVPLKHSLQKEEELRTVKGSYIGNDCGMHRVHSVGMARNNYNSYLTP